MRLPAVLVPHYELGEPLADAVASTPSVLIPRYTIVVEDRGDPGSRGFKWAWRIWVMRPTDPSCDESGNVLVATSEENGRHGSYASYSVAWYDACETMRSLREAEGV